VDSFLLPGDEEQIAVMPTFPAADFGGQSVLQK
jgi:hypothetical protein